MWPYWMMMIVPVWGALGPGRMVRGQAWMPWFAVLIGFTLLIGLRHEVGGDWFNYLPHFHLTGQLSFAEAISRGDPGYFALNWLASRIGGSIYQVNLLCAFVLMIGTVVFCRAQPRPWLALVAAVPYMLVVVGMGYTRQAVALGFALIALTALGSGRVRSFVFWIAVGALFHKSAVLLLPIAALASSRNRFLTGILVVATSLLLYYLLVADSAEALWRNYVSSNYESEGGLVRVVMNVVPALFVLFFGKRLVPDIQERRLWIWMSVFALICLPLVGFASTAVDRVALYLIPLQLFAFSRLPVLAASAHSRTSIVLGIVAYYSTVLFVWLYFASHSQYWLPYQLMPLR